MVLFYFNFFEMEEDLVGFVMVRVIFLDMEIGIDF